MTRYWLWLAAAVFVGYATSIPFRMTTDRRVVSAHWSRVTVNPLVAPDTGRRVSVPDVVQNVLLFVPFGVLGFIALRSSVRSPAIRLLVVVALAALLSAGVEALQLFTEDRTTSVSDCLANTIGALVGVVAAGLATRMFPRALTGLRALGVTDVPGFYPFLITAIVVAVAALEPFDFTLDVGSLVGKLHAVRADPWQFAGIRDELVEFTRYVLLGLAVTSWFRQLRVPRAGALGAWTGVAAALALEASQWIVESRAPGLEDGLVHAAGAVSGVALSRGFPYGRSLTFWAGALVVVTFAGAALQMLAPFSFATAHRPMALFPFFGYYARTSADTVSHVIEIALIYLPLGFALAFSGRGTWRLWRGPMIALAIAGLIEAVQGSIAGRFPDITDIGMAVLGGAAGGWLAGPALTKFEDWRNGVSGSVRG
jgi:VanZ family protein